MLVGCHFIPAHTYFTLCTLVSMTTHLSVSSVISLFMLIFFVHLPMFFAHLSRRTIFSVHICICAGYTCLCTLSQYTCLCIPLCLWTVILQNSCLSMLVCVYLSVHSCHVCVHLSMWECKLIYVHNYPCLCKH